MKQKQAAGTTAKHAGTTKHASQKKKHAPAKQRKTATSTAHAQKATKKAAHPKPAKARGLAESRVRPGITPFTSRERLDGPGASLADVACCTAQALAASLRLAGWPVSEQDVLALYWLTADDPDTGATILTTLEAAAEHGLAGVRPEMFTALGTSTGRSRPRARVSQGRSLILGVDLPGPHTVTVDADGEQWWSWGERHHPATWPDAVIEEAWQVSWP
jgi:hypothetical protein